MERFAPKPPFMRNENDLRVSVTAITDDPFTMTRNYAAVLLEAGTLGEIKEDEATDDEATEERALKELQRKNGKVTLEIDLENEKVIRAIAYMARGGCFGEEGKDINP